MFIWQYIDIPHEEVCAIQQQVRHNMPNNMLFFQEINISMTHFLDLEIELVALIQIPPMGGITDEGIHRDAPNLSLAINIPLENCQESITKFWKSDKPKSIKYTSNGHLYKAFNAIDCEQISEVKLIKPFIFDTNILHSVSNPQNVWRRAISIRFKKDIWHLVK
jgi:hypothetical protein